MAEEAEALKGKHWSEILAEKVVAEKKPPFIITSGITTSGPTHLGTLCEFLFPSAIAQQLRISGSDAEFCFIADIYDAFDAVPLAMQKYEKQLAPHLGKPLSDVPDPSGCHPSFGEHFLADALAVMEKFGVKAKIIRVNEVYKRGDFDSYALFFLKNEKQAAELVAKSSLRESMPPDWSPIMPICEKCGKIATTVVTKHGDDWYEYECTRDVKYTKGCGFKGKSKISGHSYKITWRLHWPTWQDFFKTSAEGAGMDHHTRGGSWDTAVAVHKEMFKKEPPVGFKYGFVLLQGKKYSKSKGIGMGVAELLQLMPPELIKYSLLKPDLQENKDIDPTGARLMQLYEEFQSASKLDKNDSALSRADRKKAIAWELASGGKQKWTASFADILLYYQLYGDWEKVGARVNDPDGVAYLKPCITKWVEKSFAPDEYSFSFKPQKAQSHKDVVKSFAEKLQKGMDAVGIHNLVFEIAAAYGVQPGELFKSLYLTLIAKERGPKMGKLIDAIGPELVKATLLKMVE